MVETKQDFYVYLHRRNDTGVIFYVGKGRGTRAWSCGDRNNRWNHIYAKHGRSVELFREGISEKEAFILEHRVISLLRKFGNLCNLTTGGEGGQSGYSPSKSTRKKLSKIMKQRIFTEEHRQKISNALKGRQPSEACKTALAKKMLGHEMAKVTRDAIRLANFGKSRPPHVIMATIAVKN